MKSAPHRAAVGLCAAVLALFVAAPTDAQTTTNRRGVLVISGQSGQSESVDARGRDVLVSGNDHRVQIRGTVRTLRVTGDNNHVRVYRVGTVRAGGRNNRVTYYRGSGRYTPRIYNTGTANLVQRSR